MRSRRNRSQRRRGGFMRPRGRTNEKWPSLCMSLLSPSRPLASYRAVEEGGWLELLTFLGGGTGGGRRGREGQRRRRRRSRRPWLVLLSFVPASLRLFTGPSLVALEDERHGLGGSVVAALQPAPLSHPGMAARIASDPAPRYQPPIRSLDPLKDAFSGLSSEGALPMSTHFT